MLCILPDMMHTPESYVRDFYFFKRSQYPALQLIHMNPDEAFETMQRQSFKLRFLELGKVIHVEFSFDCLMQNARFLFILTCKLTNLFLLNSYKMCN